MATASGTIVSQCYYNDTSDVWTIYASYEAYAGYGAGYYYVYILKFETPSFSGISEKIAINFKAINANTSTTTASIRYALCTSDANKDNYKYTNGAVTDSYQIASGTISVSCSSTTGTSNTLSINTSSLSSNTTYYLYFWANGPGISSFRVGTTNNHSVSLTYRHESVYIYNGSSWDKYVPYIYNGSSWDRYVPYIYNGSSWSRYG